MKAKKSKIAIPKNNISDSTKRAILSNLNKVKFKNCGNDFKPMVNSISTTPANNKLKPTFEIVAVVERKFLTINRPIKKQLVKPKNERCK